MPKTKPYLELLFWLIVGFGLGIAATAVLVAALGFENGAAYGQLVSYPLIFLPYMLATRGTGKPENPHSAPIGWPVCAVLAIVCTVAAAFILDSVSLLLPPMPDHLKETLEMVTEGNFVLNFVLVSIMAPFFEEWLCRGTVLRWMLEDGVRPALAITVSALFFALLHANLWQAIPAFGFGMIMGLFYCRTGSLKLTMLMHFTNNTIALICSRIDGLAAYDTFADALGWQTYLPLAIACAACIIASVGKLHKVKEC